MKVTIKDNYLNVRVGKPSVNAPCYQYLAPGSEIDVDGQLYKGDLYNGIDTWMKDAGGNYYWSGGVNTNDGNQVSFNYNKLIHDIPAEWRITYGVGVTVAILDAGFNINHSDLAKSISGTYNSVDKSTNVSPDTLIQDHGSSVAGIICSNSIDTNGIIGIAPSSKLLLIKVSDNGHIDVNNVLSGLDYAINTANVDIVNLSLSLDETEYALRRNDFLTLLDTANKKKIIVVASAGENSLLLSNHTNILQPANEDYCLSIGTINSSFLQNNLAPQFNTRVNFLTPYSQLKSCAGLLNNYSFIDNSSMAAAVLSGVSALLKSSLATRIDRESFIDKIRIFSSFDTTITPSQFSIYKL